MAKKPIEILVVEDGKENLEYAKQAYTPFEEEGLISANYATNHQDAEPLIKKIDAGILDLYFPDEKAEEIMRDFFDKYAGRALLEKEVDNSKEYSLLIEELQKKDKKTDFLSLRAKAIKLLAYEREQSEDEATREKRRNDYVEKLRIASGLLPLGFSLVKKLENKSKPAILISTAYLGHGSKQNPFYILRDIGEKICPKAWFPSEGSGFISHAIGYPYGGKQEYSGFGSLQSVEIDNCELLKKELSWEVVLKGIAIATGNKKISEMIKLPENIEERLSDWKRGCETGHFR